MRGTSAVLAFAVMANAGAAEYLSDLVTSEQDEQRALRLKAERFWQTLLDSAGRLRVEEHAELVADVERVIAELPPENAYVREALREAAQHLQRASDALLQQAATTAQLAAEQLSNPRHSQEMGSSFLSADGSVFTQAIRRFVGGGTYSEKLLAHVRSRQADILPALRGAAAVTGSVLKDTRVVTARGFDILKYDIYYPVLHHTKVPETPDIAKQVANRLIEVGGALRHRFLFSVRQVVGGIVEDFQGRQESATVTVVKSSLLSRTADAGDRRSEGPADLPAPPVRNAPPVRAMGWGSAHAAIGQRPRGIVSV